MSEIEIKQMQEKIDAGILLAQKRLIEKTKNCLLYTSDAADD